MLKKTKSSVIVTSDTELSSGDLEIMRAHQGSELVRAFVGFISRDTPIMKRMFVCSLGNRCFRKARVLKYLLFCLDWMGS